MITDNIQISQNRIFAKIFLLCSAASGCFAVIIAAAALLFINKIINIAIFCLIAGFAFIAAGAAVYFVLKKIFLPVKIQSKQSQKIEAIGYLAGGFSHEYNNMFAAVLGAAEILQASGTKENQEYIDIIIKTIKRAALLTNQLFGSARKKKMEMITVDMHQTLHSVIKILMENRTPNIHFHEDFQAKNWNVSGNFHQIKNALLNLGINAVEAIGAKQGDIYFRTGTSEFLRQTHIGIFTVEAGNYFTVSVEDTGDGFSSEQTDKIFDPYFSALESKGDLGVRLASALAAVSHHNGAIFAQSKENYGTIFTIYLPFSGRNFSQTTQIDLEKVHSYSLSIMIVDDDPLIRKVVTAMLNRMGHSVIQAESGIDAIETYKQRRSEISLVILDMVMPNMDGVSCFYELKKINPEIKVLVSSGYIDNSNMEDMEKDGLCGFISKPYFYAELEKTVANALQI